MVNWIWSLKVFLAQSSIFSVPRKVTWHFHVKKIELKITLRKRWCKFVTISRYYCYSIAFKPPKREHFFVPKVTFVKLFVRLIWQEIVWLRLVCGLVICECICLSTVFDENLEGEERNILLPLFLLSKACFATLRNFFKATCFNLCLSTTSLFISKTWILDGGTSQSWNND